MNTDLGMHADPMGCKGLTPANRKTSCPATTESVSILKSVCICVSSFRLRNFSLFFVRLPGLTASQAPQSARREDSGEGRGHAEREECPDPEKDSAGVSDPAADKSRSAHVEDKDAQTKDWPEEHDDVPRSPFGEHQRSAQPDDQDEHATDT